MGSSSRRQFLKRSGAVAAAAGVAAAMPSIAAKALKRQSEEHLPDHPSVDRPVMAHVTNMRKGLVTIYTSIRIRRDDQEQAPRRHALPLSH